VQADRPRPTRGYIIIGLVNLALAVATVVLAVAESPVALVTGLLAIICAFSLGRWSKRGGFR